MEPRKPNERELKIIEFLISKGNGITDLPVNWREEIMVAPMKDGDMGGLNIFLDSNNISPRIYGKTASEHMFMDRDGVQVIASLNLDNTGRIYELDVWKTNFGRLVEFPLNFL